MTNKPLPKPWKLARGVPEFVLTDEYLHWTVGDVIDMLKDHDPDARVWVQVGKNGLSPLEMLAGGDGELIL